MGGVGDESCHEVDIKVAEGRPPSTSPPSSRAACPPSLPAIIQQTPMPCTPGAVPHKLHSMSDS